MRRFSKEDEELFIEDYLNRFYSKFDPHDTITLLYDHRKNRFIDACFGNVIEDIYSHLTPDDIYIFKTFGVDQIFTDKKNRFLIELVHMREY